VELTGLSRMSEREEYTVEITRDTRTRVPVFELWRLAGDFHREDGPARIHRDRESGAVVAEVWEWNGKTHRENGPAVIKRRADGHIYYSAWYVNGEKIKPPPRPRPVTRTKGPPSQTNG
jgi:hypothetical protein